MKTALAVVNEKHLNERPQIGEEKGKLSIFLQTSVERENEYREEIKKKKDEIN